MIKNYSEFVNEHSLINQENELNEGFAKNALTAGMIALTSMLPFKGKTETLNKGDVNIYNQEIIQMSKRKNVDFYRNSELISDMKILTNILKHSTDIIDLATNIKESNLIKELGHKYITTSYTFNVADGSYDIKEYKEKTKDFFNNNVKREYNDKFDYFEEKDNELHYFYRIDAGDMSFDDIDVTMHLIADVIYNVKFNEDNIEISITGIRYHSVYFASNGKTIGDRSEVDVASIVPYNMPKSKSNDVVTQNLIKAYSQGYYKLANNMLKTSFEYYGYLVGAFNK